MAQVFESKDIDLFVLVVLKQGLKMYGTLGVKPNKHWTPTRMLARATEFTGKPYKKGQYMLAVADLQNMYDTIINQRHATDGDTDTN